MWALRPLRRNERRADLHDGLRGGWGVESEGLFVSFDLHLLCCDCLLEPLQLQALLLVLALHQPELAAVGLLPVLRGVELGG